MTGGERGVRRGSRTGKKSAPVHKFMRPPDVKAGARSHLKNEELRAGMLSWSPERIADYLIQVVGYDLDRRLLELSVIAQGDVAHAVAGLRRQMHIAVDVREVAWDEVRDSVARLERILVAIRCVGHNHPREGAELGWEFLLC